MAGLSYGSSFSRPEPLSSSELTLKPLPNKKTKSGMTGFYRILIIVLEVGLSFLIPEGAIGLELALGLAGASANTAVSVADNSLTGIGVGIDFAAALIPGATGLVRAAKRTSKIKNAAELERLALRKHKQLGDVFAEAAFDKSIASSTRQLRKLNVAKREVALGVTERRIVRLQEKIAKNIESGSDDTLKLISELEGNEALATGYRRSITRSLNKTKTIEEEMFENALRKYNMTIDKFNREIHEIEEIFEQVKNIPLAKKTSNNVFFNELKNITGEERYDLIKEVYFPAKAGFSTKSDRVALKSIASNLDEADRVLFDPFINALSHMQFKNKSEVELLIDTIMGKLSPEGRKAILKLTDNKDLFNRVTNVYNFEPSWRRRLIKTVGSRKFNDDVVQRLQLIDPNDIGRMPIEQAYQFLKKKIRKAYSRKAAATAEKEALDNLRDKGLTTIGRKVGKNALKKEERIRQAFVKSGGVLIPGRTAPFSRYLLGYKVIESFPGRNMVLFKFNKAYTSSNDPLSHNYNGKKDIITWASDYDLARLKEDGTEYFWLNKHRGKWWTSRGGKLHRHSAFAASNELSLFLGFVPIPALRNMLSIVSNWVENVSDMAEGNYIKNWVAKFTRSITRSAINRSARLFTREIVGGAVLRKATKMIKINGVMTKITYSKNAWVGRELQRLASTSLSVIETKDPQTGMFKFKTSGFGRHHDKSFGQEWGEKMWKTAAPTSLKSNMIRSSTKRRRTAARRLIGAKRNLGQMGRVYGAVTPNSKVKQMRTLTRIKL